MKKMLPDVLYLNYQQYKCDTDCFVSWLAETAIICGHAVRSYPAPIVAASSISDDGSVTAGGVTTGRLKGKARKEAKITAKKAASSRPAPKQILALNEFADLTNKIARYSKKSVQLPSPVLHAVQRAIAARRNIMPGSKARRSKEKNATTPTSTLSKCWKRPWRF